MSQNNNKKTEFFKINCHQRKVEDLPQRFMRALLSAMHDKSYGNDDAASFCAKHNDKDKAYHLWVDHLDIEMRCEDEEFRFCLQIIGFNSSYSEGDDFIDHLDNSFPVSVMSTNSHEELARKLCELLPLFNEEYNR